MRKSKELASQRTLEWGGPGFREAPPLPPPEPASPSAEHTGSTDLLSRVRYLHMTCPFVNLAPQLLASLHLCLPSCAHFAGAAAPPWPPSLPAGPPPLELSQIEPTLLLSISCHVGLGGWLSAVSFPLVLLDLFLWLLLLLLAAFSTHWEPRTQAAAPWRSSRTLRVNSLRALPRRLPGASERTLPPTAPLFAWQFCIASLGSQNKKGKKKKMSKLLGCWDKLA